MSIAFGGTTIYNEASTGVSFKFSPNVIVGKLREEEMPLTNGIIFGDLGEKGATHTLKIVWKDSSPADILSTLRQAARHKRATFSVPDWGSFNKCCIVDIQQGEEPKLTDGGNYLIEYILTIRQSA